MKNFNSGSLGETYRNSIFVGDINNGNLYLFKINQARNGLEFDSQQSVFRKLINYCRLKGAENVALVDSYYISGELPNRPKVLEFVLSLTCKIKDLTKICDDICNFYLQFNNRANITVTRKNNARSLFIKENEKKGFLRAIVNNEMQDDEISSRIIDIEIDREILFFEVRRLISLKMLL